MNSFHQPINLLVINKKYDELEEFVEFLNIATKFTDESI